MRLIDADRFLEYMTGKCDMSAELDPIILGVFRGALKEQPTAYDVDKVVEELEKATQYIKIDGKPTSVKAIHQAQAIEIVKQGSMGKDVE